MKSLIITIFFIGLVITTDLAQAQQYYIDSTDYNMWLCNNVPGAQQACGDAGRSRLFSSLSECESARRNALPYDTRWQRMTRCVPYSSPVYGNGGHGTPSMGFHSTGDWRTDITMMFASSILQGIMRGIQEGIAQREASRKRALEEWRRKVRAQYKEALARYHKQRELEFEKKKSELLGNLKFPKDSKMMKALLCSKYWSKRAEEVANSPSPDALVHAETYDRKAELAMMGDIADCPAEAMLLVKPPEISASNMEFGMRLRTLMMVEESRIRESVKELDVKLDKLRNKFEKEKRRVELLKNSTVKKGETKNKGADDESGELLKEAMKKYEESKKALEKAEDEKKKLENELLAVQKTQKELESMGGIK